MPGFLTGLLNAATQGASGYEGGVDRANDRNASLAMLMAQRAESKRVDDARIADYTARANKPAPVVRDPIADFKAKRDYSISHPLPTRGRSSGASANMSLVHALSSTQRQEQLAGTNATAAEKDLATRYPEGAPTHVDPTIPGDSGFLGIGATPAHANPAYPTYKADSTQHASAVDRVRSALATRDSLAGVAGKLSSRLNAAAMGGGGADDGSDDEDDAPTPGSTPIMPATQPRSAAPRAAAAPASAAHLPEAQTAFQQAADALKAAGGPGNASARAQYDRVVAGIANHFQLEPPSVPSPGPGGTQATPNPDE
jgi:hypothetical protein